MPCCPTESNATGTRPPVIHPNVATRINAGPPPTAMPAAGQTAQQRAFEASAPSHASRVAQAMLKLHLEAAEHLWDETIWDACTPEFTRAFDALEAALEAESKETRRAEFDTQFTPSLYKALTFIARACRHPVLRRDALALLRRSLGVATARLSRVTGNMVMEFIAHQIIDVEEIAWREDAARNDCGEGSKCVKDSFVCNMHRIARVLAPSEIPERIVDYTLLTTRDILHGREGHKESVRAVFFS